MDARFRKNHQLQLLLKRRTYVPDHELYEMMRSKRVFRAQNELRRELERRLQEIRLDQKVKVAGYMVQKATFLKMVAARDKSLRHLLDVKKLMGDDSLDLVCADLDESEPIHDEQRGLGILDDNISTNDIVYLNDSSDILSERQETYFTPTVNNEWMRKISKRVTNKGKSKQERRNSHIPKIHLNERVSNEKEKSERASNKSNEKETSTRLLTGEILSDEMNVEVKNLEQDFEKKNNTTDNILEIVVSEVDPKKDTQDGEDKENSDELKYTESSSILLPKIHSDKRHFDDDGILNKDFNPVSVSQKSLLEPSIPILSKHSSKTSPNVCSTRPHQKLPPLQERERSVTMLFVEKSDDEDDEFVTEVSPFDIEAFIQYKKRTRGYSIILSSTNFPQKEEKNVCEDTVIKKKRNRTNTISSNHSQHQNFWGVKEFDDISPRRRSKQWYEDFMKSKQFKKLHSKTKQQKSFDFENRIQIPHEGHDPYSGDKNFEWKSSSSDQHISKELLYQHRLQRLKQHCQTLSQRVDFFVNS